MALAVIDDEQHLSWHHTLIAPTNPQKIAVYRMPLGNCTTTGHAAVCIRRSRFVAIHDDPGCRQRHKARVVSLEWPSRTTQRVSCPSDRSLALHMPPYHLLPQVSSLCTPVRSAWFRSFPQLRIGPNRVAGRGLVLASVIAGHTS